MACFDVCALAGAALLLAGFVALAGVAVFAAFSGAGGVGFFFVATAGVLFFFAEVFLVAMTGRRIRFEAAYHGFWLGRRANFLRLSLGRSRDGEKEGAPWRYGARGRHRHFA